jgi:uncharacterized phage protein (TIGR01671 family)
MREIKFQSVHRHHKTQEIELHPWGFIDSGFSGPAWISGYETIAHRQLTGLLDKNGKEIYEGDIVRLTNDTNQVQRKSIISEIGFYDCSFTAYWRQTELWEGYNVSPSSVVFLNSVTSNQVEVIGNIYENPDLLKKL